MMGQKGVALILVCLAVLAVFSLATLGIAVSSGLKKSQDVESAKKLPAAENWDPAEGEAGQEKLEQIDPDNPPRFIQKDLVELDKVFAISKFRSGMGHDYSYASWSGETCRSMKHYFMAKDPNQPDYQLEGMDYNNFPRPNLETGVKIFSPVDGTLKFNLSDKRSFDDEVQVYPDAYPGIKIGLGHVQPAPGVKEGKVKAGDLIGLILANQSYDVAISYSIPNPKNVNAKMVYLSYFSIISDKVFAKYQERGVKSREQMIFTKEYIDQNPWKCIGKEVFVENYVGSLEGHNLNIVDLSGYDEIEKLMNKKYPNPNPKPDPNAAGALSGPLGNREY